MPYDNLGPFFYKRKSLFGFYLENDDRQHRSDFCSVISTKNVRLQIKVFFSTRSADRSADYQLGEILIPGRRYVYQMIAMAELSTMADFKTPQK